jgi:mannose-6-phosphate isomerase-like protein (cupin superfamily)
MKKSKRIMLCAAIGAGMFLGFGMGAQEQAAKREPMTFSLECAGGDCVLLKGAPQTSGMRGGSVKLKPGESVGWHSTGENEEALTILHGVGTAKIDGHADVPLHEKMLAYIPPGTRHSVTNTGSDVLEYVWVVAPVGSSRPRPPLG